MKRKGLMTILIAAALLISFNAQVFAATGWYVCTIQEIGPSSGGYVYLYLKSSPITGVTGTFTGPKWFKATSSEAARMLATALTAASLGKKIKINADPTLSLPEITTLYMLNS